MRDRRGVVQRRRVEGSASRRQQADALTPITVAPFRFILVKPRELRQHTLSEVYMRTNIVLDDRLMAEAMKLTKARSKREAVDLALRELISRRRRKNVLDLVGQDLIAPDYDVRAVRAGMKRGSGR